MLLVNFFQRYGVPAYNVCFGIGSRFDTRWGRILRVFFGIKIPVRVMFDPGLVADGGIGVYPGKMVESAHS